MCCKLTRLHLCHKKAKSTVIWRSYRKNRKGDVFWNIVYFTGHRVKWSDYNTHYTYCIIYDINTKRSSVYCCPAAAPTTQQLKWPSLITWSEFISSITATSPIRHPTTPSRTAPPAQLLWQMGFLCDWSVGLEFPAGQLAESDYWREQFQTISEDVSVSNVLMHSAQ